MVEADHFRIDAVAGYVLLGECDEQTALYYCLNPFEFRAGLEPAAAYAKHGIVVLIRRPCKTQPAPINTGFALFPRQLHPPRINSPAIDF